MSTENSIRLQTHTYPIAIKALGIIILVLFFFALSFIPRYIVAGRNIKKGERYRNVGEYDQAIIFLEKAFEAVPSSKKVKMELAFTYFSNSNKEDDEIATYYLEDLALNNDEWSRFARVMPAEYQKYFTTISSY